MVMINELKFSIYRQIVHFRFREFHFRSIKANFNHVWSRIGHFWPFHHFYWRLWTTKTIPSSNICCLFTFWSISRCAIDALRIALKSPTKWENFESRSVSIFFRFYKNSDVNNGSSLKWKALQSKWTTQGGQNGWSEWRKMDGHVAISTVCESGRSKIHNWVDIAALLHVVLTQNLLERVSLGQKYCSRVFGTLTLMWQLESETTQRTYTWGMA